MPRVARCPPANSGNTYDEEKKEEKKLGAKRERKGREESKIHTKYMYCMDLQVWEVREGFVCILNTVSLEPCIHTMDAYR